MTSLRSEIRAFLGVPEASDVGDVRVHEEQIEDGYTRALVSYSSLGETVQAYFFEPLSRSGQSAVLALHQHNSEWAIGKSEIAGLAGDPLQAFGPALARRGVPVLAPDAVGFESRRGISTAGLALAPPVVASRGAQDQWLQYYNHAAHRLVRGELLMAKILADVAAAVAVLEKWATSNVVGLVGHSYGGNVALFAAALDTRIAFTCSSGAACSFRHKLARGTGLEMALVIPGFAARFDFDDLMRCIAPRRLLVVSSSDDPFTADAGDLVARARPAFDAVNARDCLKHLHFPGPHALDERRFTAMLDWLTSEAAATGGDHGDG